MMKSWKNCPADMLVLGVDPGLAATGYGLIACEAGLMRLVEGGVVRSHSDHPMEKRVGDIYNGLLEVLDEFHPDIISMEDLYSHYKHPRTAIIMGHARGAVLVAADQRKVPVIHYASTMIKMALTGNGRAKKEQVQRMVMSLLGLTTPMEPYDTSDALAAALCHINQNMKAMIS
jgi:crossover junction endodeoxyribonuclease RuvC